jgi:transcription-repair coupling factor (superfamily II helicase)
VAFLQEQAGTAKLRPDQRVVIMRNWEDTRQRLGGINALLRRLAEIAAAPAPAPAIAAAPVAQPKRSSTGRRL